MTKQLTEKQIRKNVVIGIWQWIGYLVLGLFIWGLVFSFCYFCIYKSIYQVGYNRASEDFATQLIDITNLEGDVHVYSKTLDEHMTLEKYHSCGINSLLSAPYYFGYNPYSKNGTEGEKLI
jgi:hypothetical protein